MAAVGRFGLVVAGQRLGHISPASGDVPQGLADDRGAEVLPELKKQSVGPGEVALRGAVRAAIGLDHTAVGEQPGLTELLTRPPEHR